MNMFRNILTVACLCLGISLWVLPEDQWRWVDLLGSQAVTALNLMRAIEPFSSTVLIVVALALFMTRKQY